MLQALTEVTRNIVVLIILAAVLELLLPRSEFRPYLNMVVGLILMLMLLTPLRMLLQMPGGLEPAFEWQYVITQDEVDARQAVMERVNEGLTLNRYRELLTEKISRVFTEEGMYLSECVLQLEENPDHLEFGRPLSLSVVAVKTSGGGDVIRPVEEIRIGQSVEGEVLFEQDAGMARKLAGVTGLAEEKIAVKVLKY